MFSAEQNTAQKLVARWAAFQPATNQTEDEARRKLNDLLAANGFERIKALTVELEEEETKGWVPKLLHGLVLSYDNKIVHWFMQQTGLCKYYRAVGNGTYVYGPLYRIHTVHLAYKPDAPICNINISVVVCKEENE